MATFIEPSNEIEFMDKNPCRDIAISAHKLCRRIVNIYMRYVNDNMRIFNVIVKIKEAKLSPENTFDYDSNSKIYADDMAILRHIYNRMKKHVNAAQKTFEQIKMLARIAFDAKKTEPKHISNIMYAEYILYYFRTAITCINIQIVMLKHFANKINILKTEKKMHTRIAIFKFRGIEVEFAKKIADNHKMHIKLAKYKCKDLVLEQKIIQLYDVFHAKDLLMTEFVSKHDLALIKLVSCDITYKSNVA